MIIPPPYKNTVILVQLSALLVTIELEFLMIKWLLKRLSGIFVVLAIFSFSSPRLGFADEISDILNDGWLLLIEPSREIIGDYEKIEVSCSFQKGDPQKPHEYIILGGNTGGNTLESELHNALLQFHLHAHKAPNFALSPLLLKELNQFFPKSIANMVIRKKDKEIVIQLSNAYRTLDPDEVRINLEFKGESFDEVMEQMLKLKPNSFARESLFRKISKLPLLDQKAEALKFLSEFESPMLMVSFFGSSVSSLSETQAYKDEKFLNELALNYILELNKEFGVAVTKAAPAKK